MIKWMQSKNGVRILLTILLCLILSNCMLIFMTKWLQAEIDGFQKSGSEIFVKNQAIDFMDDLSNVVETIATQFTIVTLGLMLVSVVFLMIHSSVPASSPDPDFDDEDSEDELDDVDMSEDVEPNKSLLQASLLQASLMKPELATDDLPGPDTVSDDSGTGDAESDEIMQPSGDLPVDALLNNGPSVSGVSALLEGLEDEDRGTLAHSYTKMVEALQKIADLEKQHSEELASANTQLYREISDRKNAEAEIRRLSSRLMSINEDARKELARDLHDEFGQTLTALHLGLEGLWNSIPMDLGDQKKRIDDLVILVEQLGDRIRSISSDLRPDLLDDLGLVPTLDWYISEFTEKRKDILVDFQAVGLRKRLSPDVELVLYRIFQEGLNNIVKHSRAKNATVTLTYSHPKVILTIQDDGVGFDTAVQSSDGIGLLGMRERVVTINGTIDIHSAPGKGVRIRVEIPVQNEEETNE